jgi:hypothetical protein
MKCKNCTKRHNCGKVDKKECPYFEERQGEEEQ